MAGKISDEVLQTIRERVSIVEVVSGYVTLKKAGKNYLGLCPFHSEKTPSFTVNDERGLFHCFGCGAGGTVFTFVMRAERVAFPEAVELLARRAGVVLPQRDAGAGGERREELLALNERAQECFRNALLAQSGMPARQYLERRGLSPATIERYGLGFCPKAGAGLVRAMAGKKGGIEKALELGLIGRRSDGTTYDRLWNRVTFPIRNSSGHIVGFGGRTIGTEQPKYLNSPESMIFHKAQVLYGLFEAREAIRHAERVVIVEGYLDALALVEAGIGDAVASLGTALSSAQLRLARRFAPEVVAFFDGDRAGQDAAMRAFALCAEVGVWGIGAFLPDGFDPDSYVRAKGLEATRALLRDAIPLADFFLDRLDPGPDATFLQRAQAAERIAEVVARVADPLQSSLLASKAAQRLGIDEATFRSLLAKRGPAPATGPGAAEQISRTFRPEEITLLEAMALDRGAAFLAADHGVIEALGDATLAKAGRAILAAWEGEGNGASVAHQLPEELAERVAAGLLGASAMAASDRCQIAMDCIRRIKDRALRAERKKSLADLRHAEATGDEAMLRQQLERKNALLRRKEVNSES